MTTQKLGLLSIAGTLQATEKLKLAFKILLYDN